MKRLFSSRYSFSLLFLCILVCWSLISFFGYHIKLLPEKLPQPLYTYLTKEILPGEKIFLADARFDQLIWNYPELDIQPGSGISVKQAGGETLFYLISDRQLPRDFGKLPGFKIDKVVQDQNFSLFRFSKGDMAFRTLRLSSLIDKIRVNSSFYPGGAAFKEGQYITGPEPWNYISVRNADFDKKPRTLVSMHPLHGSDKYLQVISPALETPAQEIVFEWGVADSGKCGSCKQISVTVTQDTLKKEFKSADGVLQRAVLEGFDGRKPIGISITVENAGMRHFYIELTYTIPRQTT